MEVPILIFLIFLIVFFFVNAPRYLVAFNIITLIRWISAVALIALGESLVICVGGIDLSAGSFIALSNVLVAIFMIWYKIPTGIAICMVVALAMMIGLGQGSFCVRFSPPLPFIAPAFVISLGTYYVAYGLAVLITKGYPIVPVPNDFSYIAYGLVGGIVPVPFILILGALFLAIYIVRVIPFGNHILAVGGNPDAALFSGVNVKKVRVFAFAWAGAMYGVAGVLIGGLINEGNPGVGPQYLLIAIAAPVLGGVSLAGGSISLIGILIGAAVTQVISSGFVFLTVSPYYTDIVMGILLVSAVTLDLIRRLKV